MLLHTQNIIFTHTENIKKMQIYRQLLYQLFLPLAFVFNSYKPRQ